MSKNKTILSPFIIASKQNVGILKKAAEEVVGGDVRSITAKTLSLSAFVKTQLKNYTYNSHIVLDLDVFSENDGNLIDLIDGMMYQVPNVRLIFYTGKRYEDNELLNTLVQHGHHNIVALYTGMSDKKCIEQMYEDLIGCFTEDGLPTKVWRRFDKSYDAAAEMRREAQRAERELNRKCFANTELKVAVVGTQARIGSTSFAVHLAHYFAKHGGKPIVIGMQTEKAFQLDMLKDFYDGSCKNGIYSVGAVNFCTIGTNMRDYPIKIFDYGNIPSEQMQLYGFEKVYLVGGLSWNELAPFYQRQADMNDTNYTVVVNFSDDEHIERFRDMLSVNESEIICAPLESDTFSSDSYEHIFAKAFAEWQTEAENEQEI